MNLPYCEWTFLGKFYDLAHSRALEGETKVKKGGKNAKTKKKSEQKQKQKLTPSAYFDVRSVSKRKKIKYLKHRVSAVRKSKEQEQTLCNHSVTAFLLGNAALLFKNIALDM